MNGKRLDDILEGIKDFGFKAEVREFGLMEFDEQLIQLYISIHDKRATQRGALLNGVYTTLGLLYVLTIGWKPW